MEDPDDFRKRMDIWLYHYMIQNNKPEVATSILAERARQGIEVFPKTVAMDDGSLRSQATHPSFPAETGLVAVEHQMQEMDLGPKNEGDRSKKSN